MEPIAETPTPRDLLLSVPQPDDSGADTLDRYDWQATMAAADGLRLYLDALDAEGSLSDQDYCRIVCEYHEDWSVVSGGDVELVSAKHRETSKGAFTTINQLADAGGVAHLFGRWHALSETPSCRLVTTAGLAPEVQKLQKAWEYFCQLRLRAEPLSLIDEHDQPVRDLCQSIRRYCKTLPESWAAHTTPVPKPTDAELDQVTRFMSVLSVQHSKPLREHIGFAAANMYAKPILDRLKISIDPESVWSAVHDLFYERMHKAGPVPTGKLPAVLQYRLGATPPTSDELERSLSNRIVTTADINVAIKTAIAQPHGYRPIPRLRRTTRIAVKMTAGMCADNSVERAEHLCQDYRNFWRDERSGEPAARAEQARLHRYLLRICDEATTSTRDSNPKGPALWHELQRRLDAMPADQVPRGIDSDLLLGGICDLTSQCKVWFSDSFDVNAAIKSLHREQGQAS